MRRFYFYRRNGVYYAKLNTPSGVSLSRRSTKTRNRNEALLIVAEWLKNGVTTGRERKPKPVALAVDLPGILKAIRQADLDTEDAMTIVSTLRERELVDFGVTKTGPGREKFISFLSRFWDLDRSPYLKDKSAPGHRITQKYCREAAQKIARHWEPYFRDTVALNGITRKELREFSIVLHDKGLTSSTINNIMIVGTSALKWAFTERMIPIDPTEGLTTFTGEGKSRDILKEKRAQVKNIPLSDIKIKENVRKEYTGIDELAESIRKNGLIQPITVYYILNEGYIVKTCHRRFLAYHKLCAVDPDLFRSIPCLVSTADNIAVVQLVENVLRSDLSATELYESLSALRDNEMSLKDIASVMGKKTGSVKNFFVAVNEIDANPKLKECLENGHAGVTIQDIIVFP